MYDIRLNNNRINDQNGAEILAALPESLRQLDISRNCFGPKSIKSFVTNITGWDTFRLCIIDLSHNMIQSKGCQVIFNGLLDANIKTLQRLNLSHNGIGADTNVKDVGLSIARFLKLPDQNLVDLDLSWNRIRGLQAVTLINGLTENKSLAKFSYAWNGLESSSRQKTGAPEHPYRKILAAKAKAGGGKKKGGAKKRKVGPRKKERQRKKRKKKTKKAAKERLPPWPIGKVNPDVKADYEESVLVVNAIGELLEKNKTLQILDLSYNNFDTSAVEIFNDKLKNNHRLLEIRLKGSNVEIDSWGFLHPNNGNVMSIISSQHLADETNSSGDGGKVSVKSYRSGAWVDNTWPTDVIDSQYPQGWVSGGWDEVKIVFSPSTYFVTKESEELGTWDDIENVFIRFKLDGWKPYKDEEKLG